jgi:PAS domain-containing protein
VDIEADPDTDAIELRNLRLLGEYCSDVIATVTPNMLFSYISPSVERLFGWPVEAALGHPIVIFCRGGRLTGNCCRDGEVERRRNNERHRH